MALFVVSVAVPCSAGSIAAALAQGDVLHAGDTVYELARTTAKVSAHHPDGVLSERQWEVLELRIRGLSDAEVAVRLSISQKTVRNLRCEAHRRLGVDNVGAATVAALRLGLIDLESA